MNSNRMSNAFPHCRGKSRQGENRQNLNVFVMLAKVQGVFEYVSVNIPGHVRIYIYIFGLSGGHFVLPLVSRFLRFYFGNTLLMLV